MAQLFHGNQHSQHPKKKHSKLPEFWKQVSQRKTSPYIKIFKEICFKSTDFLKK